MGHCRTLQGNPSESHCNLMVILSYLKDFLLEGIASNAGHCRALQGIARKPFRNLSEIVKGNHGIVGHCKALQGAPLEYHCNLKGGSLGAFVN